MPDQPDQPTRLNLKTYLQVIRNSVGSGMFRNFYVETPDRGEFDALDDGANSCAFYVSSVLVIFGKLARTHGTVLSTVWDLEHSGWESVESPQPGDVLIWEAQDFDDGRYQHVGFCLDEKRAVSTSLTKKVVVMHDLHFGDQQRRIERVYRMKKWTA